MTGWNMAGLKWEKAFGPLNVYPSCHGSNRLFSMRLPVKTVMTPSIQSGAKAKCFFTSSKRFWCHCCFSAKANAAASKTGISEPHWCYRMFLLLCERWLECIYKFISVLFFLKNSCLVVVTTQITQSCRWVLVAHLHVTAGFLFSQFVLRDVMAGSHFTVYQGGGSRGAGERVLS